MLGATGEGEGTVICPVCSVSNAAGANYCSACGEALPEPVEVATGSYPVVGVDVAGDGEVGQLIVTRGSNAGARFALDADEVSIGRHPDSGIFFDDVTVSRRHARVTHEPGGQYLLHDAGSLNGTYLDGERIEAALLREGAHVQVGKFRLVFVIGTLGGAA